MCTVTFIPFENRNVITSNRDEHTSRPVSFAPSEEVIDGLKIVYPKDPKAGGTWFAINENGAICVLLNGAFKKHLPTGNYRKSRGLILLDIISKDSPTIYLEQVDLSDIEPFTLVVLEDQKLMELRWDGTIKHCKDLDESKSHIWSSATLYDDEVVQHRKDLFETFLTEKSKIDLADIISFHSNDYGDSENGFVIHRNSGLKTFSTTQATIAKDEIAMSHLDLLQNKKHLISIDLKGKQNKASWIS